MATVSHEIKSPLGIIRSTAEILEKRIKKVAPGNEHLARIITEETSRLNNITVEFLDFARPQQAKLQRGDINEVVKKALIFIKPKAAEQHVEIEEDLHHEQLSVEFDSELLYRALLNMLVNALQAMETGGVLRVATRPHSEAGGAEVEISDTGVGMSESKIEHIFNPFYTDKQKGTGLGLSITKNIVDSHNGELRVASTEQHGSVLLQIHELRFRDNGPYSLAVQQHDIIGLSGQSGIGKTQLLRAIVETINYSGTIAYKESPSDTYTPSQWRRLIGLIPAESQWWRDTVAEHFAREIPQEYLEKLITDLGFDTDILSWKIEHLSTGERQRLALARALVLNPSVVLLDEPCSALDAHSTERVENILLSYREKPDTALIWVSHDDEQLKRVASSCFTVTRHSLEVRW